VNADSGESVETKVTKVNKAKRATMVKEEVLVGKDQRVTGEVKEM